MFRYLQLFELFQIVFGSVGIYGTVLRIFPDMNYISNVSESEKKRWNVGNDIPTIPYNVKMSEPFAYLAFQTAVYDARTAETVAVDIFRDIGTVVDAKLVA